jgi:methyl-accepting chemotaxis protein
MSVLLGRTGLGGLLIVIIAVWAGAAVFMLAGTLRAADRIDDRVGSIRTDVVAADENLDNVKLAARTSRIAAKIDVSAKPLSGQFTQIIAAAGSIDRNAGSILETAGSINRTAGSINTNVRSIGGRVVSIEGNARSIDSRVSSIGSSVGSIGANADSINRRVRGIDSNASSIERRVGLIDRNARSINGRVGSILQTAGSIGGRVVNINSAAGPILPTVESIDVGAAGINRRAERVTEIVENKIKDDTGKIFEEVDEVHQNANSIDCSAAIQLLRSFSGEGRNRCHSHRDDRDDDRTSDARGRDDE